MAEKKNGNTKGKDDVATGRRRGLLPSSVQPMAPNEL